MQGSRIPQLDGLRGLAILLVLFYHGGPIGFGWVGVDLFFVLSGFLITGILYDSRDAEGYFCRFYERRVLRIFPLYFVVLAFSFFIAPQLVSRPDALFPGDSGNRAPYFLFIQNLTVSDLMNGSLFVTWSLAIEEQFYLGWPFLVLLLNARQLQLLLAALLVMLPTARYLILLTGHSPTFVQLNTLCRLDGLALGGIMALSLRNGLVSMASLQRWFWPSFLVGALGCTTTLILGISPSSSGAPILASLQYSFLAVTFGALLGIVHARQCSFLTRVFQNRFLMYTGSISYGLYLLHPIVNGFLLGAVHRFHLPM